MAFYEIKSKKGVSLQGWMEAGIGIILVLVLLALVVSDMNGLYNQNHDQTFGIGSDETQQKFKDYQGTVQEGLQGEATTSTLTGINIGTAWGMTLASINIAIDVVTGQWIYNAVGLLHLGAGSSIVAIMLQVLYVGSLAFIVLRMILKVNP